jgi:DNA sulfur modification protein DndC
MQADLFVEEPPVEQLIQQGALFVCSHSGGKDSQAMYNLLRFLVPADQLVVVHAHLPGVEWDGVREHILATIDVPYYECQAGKTFLEMVEHRQMWPSAEYRQCTSDLKRGPLEKLIRRIARERQATQVINCMGMRAQESPARKKKPVWKHSARHSKKGRDWYEWLPIHDYLLHQVFTACGTSVAQWQERMARWQAGDTTGALAGWPCHWAYVAGMSRLSCCFCIMASEADLTRAAQLRPALLDTFIALEERIGHTFRMPGKTGADVSLKQYRPIA